MVMEEQGAVGQLALLLAGFTLTLGQDKGEGHQASFGFKSCRPRVIWSECFPVPDLEIKV